MHKLFLTSIERHSEQVNDFWNFLIIYVSLVLYFTWIIRRGFKLRFRTRFRGFKEYNNRTICILFNINYKIYNNIILYFTRRSYSVHDCVLLYLFIRYSTIIVIIMYKAKKSVKWPESRLMMMPVIYCRDLS